MRGRTSNYNARTRLRSAGYKCSLCGRRMIDAEALKRHNKTIHNISGISGRNKQVSLNTKVITAKQPVLSAKERRERNDKAFDALLKDDTKPNVNKRKKFASKGDDIRSGVKEVLAKENLKKNQKCSKSSSDTIQNRNVESKIRNGVKSKDVQTKKRLFKRTRRVEFECPICEGKFCAYFSALKHIQKEHGVNLAGEKVPPCSPDLIKPIRIEQCMKCNNKIRSTEPHECPEMEMTEDEIGKASFFICTACHQGSVSMRVFDLHVAGLHSEGVHSLFFPTQIEFTNWRLEMERETKTKYFPLGEYDSKKIYRCSYAKENKLSDKSTAHLCPSSMVVQEFSKGIQVHYYKDHFDHEAKEYKLLKKYRKYSITSFLKRAENYTVTDLTTDDNDLYMQFKILMENIVLDAAKINIQNLNVLIEKALEMTSVLTNYEEEADDCKPLSNIQKMSDKEISDALQDTRKRKMSMDCNDMSEVATRTRRKSLYASPSRGTSPVILNTFSLAPTTAKDAEPVIEAITVKVDRNDSADAKDVKPDLDVKVETPAKITNSIRVSRFSQSTSFNDTYKDFVDKTIQATIAADKSFKEKAKKRSPRITPALKTKIGQFKPSVSPKNTDSDSSEPLIKMKAPDKPQRKLVISPKEAKSIPKEENTVPKVPKTVPKVTTKPKVNVQSVKRKPDFEYEIRERENDCNILILKI